MRTFASPLSLEGDLHEQPVGLLTHRVFLGPSSQIIGDPVTSWASSAATVAGPCIYRKLKSSTQRSQSWNEFQALYRLHLFRIVGLGITALVGAVKWPNEKPAA